MSEHIAGFTSTGSKRPETLFGVHDPSLPLRMTRSAGCCVWDEHGREYTDYIMGLGSVALGYAHPTVVSAASSAVAAGAVGPLGPVLEEEVASTFCRLVPWLERVRFLKTGAEAMAAAVRLARVYTGREGILGCGYHGWLDWSQGAAGVPLSTRALYGELPFNDPEGAREQIRASGNQLAAVVFEPVVVSEPSVEWLRVLREETTRVGALLVVDEIKTACRLAIGGACERYSIRPDLVVMGKAIANGFPLALVGGRSSVMAGVNRTWISSTLATEFVSLAAAQATLETMESVPVMDHLQRTGIRLLEGLRSLSREHADSITGVGGIPQMCFLHYSDEAVSQAVTAACAHNGLLFKRSAYNFVSLAHDEVVVDRSLELLAEALSAVTKPA
ncbi:MAG TPA: aminotransferase class III-fold pyridoxal phosphate-dependent enzyme [Gemmatimonadales bacterium]|nr:aminotransferase class III-fold pyridoxal phosphate-dependent enzyme [Gemmatimonadales bacterium]